MEIPYLDLHAQYLSIRDDVRQAIDRVLESKAFILGKEVEAFEAEFAKFSHLSHVVGCSNGTDAITLALAALKIGPGDEVITTPFTFIATAETIAMRGAKPVFLDISLEDYNLDPDKIAAKISPKTKAIIAVHLYGQPARMPEICEVARKHNLHVIEDAAQAHGATIGGQPIGSFGTLATFSFYPGKNIGAYGDAGALATQDEKLAKTLRLLRDHGRSEKYTHELLGYNNRMDGLQAAILRVKLKHLEKWTKARQRCAEQYRELLKDAKGVIVPNDFPKARSVAHLFVIRHPKRDALHQALTQRGVPTLVHYPIGLHLQPCFKYLGHREGDFPNTERAAREVLSIPCYPELTDEKIAYISQNIRDAAKELA